MRRKNPQILGGLEVFAPWWLAIVHTSVTVAISLLKRSKAVLGLAQLRSGDEKVAGEQLYMAAAAVGEDTFAAAAADMLAGVIDVRNAEVFDPAHFGLGDGLSHWANVS